MRSAKRILLAASLLVGAASAAQALDPWGVWVRPDGGEKFDFYNCGGNLCAKLVDVEKEEDRGGVGFVVLRNAAKTAENNWKGDIVNPQNNKTYIGKVILQKPGELILEGCLIGFLCKGETWTRAPDQKLASTPGGKPQKPAYAESKDAPTKAAK